MLKANDLKELQPWQLRIHTDVIEMPSGHHSARVHIITLSYSIVSMVTDLWRFHTVYVMLSN